MSGVYKFIQASDIPVGGKNNFAVYAGTPEEVWGFTWVCMCNIHLHVSAHLILVHYNMVSH